MVSTRKGTCALRSRGTGRGSGALPLSSAPMSLAGPRAPCRVEFERFTIPAAELGGRQVCRLEKFHDYSVRFGRVAHRLIRNTVAIDIDGPKQISSFRRLVPKATFAQQWLAIGRRKSRLTPELLLPACQGVHRSLAVRRGWRRGRRVPASTRRRSPE